jgi:predicted nucleic acid-binding protein
VVQGQPVSNQVVVVVTDANIIITLIQSNQLNILARLPAHRFIVPQDVIAEVTEAHQSAVLTQAIETGSLQAVELTGVTELENYAQLRKILGRGESACIAIAEARGWSIASDEKRRFLRTAVERLGQDRILTTEDIRKIARASGIQA